MSQEDFVAAMDSTVMPIVNKGERIVNSVTSDYEDINTYINAEVECWGRTSHRYFAERTAANSDDGDESDIAHLVDSMYRACFRVKGLYLHLAQEAAGS